MLQTAVPRMRLHAQLRQFRAWLFDFHQLRSCPRVDRVTLALSALLITDFVSTLALVSTRYEAAAQRLTVVVFLSRSRILSVCPT